MIALIQFLNPDDAFAIVTKKQAEKFNLSSPNNEYEYCKKDDKIVIKRFYYSFRKDLLKKEDENGKVKYFLVQEDGTEKEKEHYYVVDEVDQDKYQAVHSQQVVNLIEFASSWNGPEYKIIKGVKEAPSNESISVLQNILSRMEEKVKNLAEVFDKSLTFNQKCDVHVGGGLIATYNEVMLKEDCCTDVLQEELAKGWRIIACCVQKDQRRPDYILGRYNQDFFPTINAKR